MAAAGVGASGVAAVGRSRTLLVDRLRLRELLVGSGLLLPRLLVLPDGLLFGLAAESEDFLFLPAAAVGRNSDNKAEAARN